MKHEDRTTENEKLIEDYKKKGFKDCFKYESGNLVDTSNNNRFVSNDIQVLEECKLAVNGKPTEDILVVFRTKNHTKGLFVIDEGARENLQLKEFFKAIPDQNIVKNESAESGL